FGFDPEGFAGKELRGGFIEGDVAAPDHGPFLGRTKSGDNDPIQCAGRVMPSLFIRFRRVLAWSPRTLAAPRGPVMSHLVCRRAARMWSRSTTSRLGRG